MLEKIKIELIKQLHDPFFWFMIGIFVGFGIMIIVSMIIFSKTT